MKGRIDEEVQDVTLRGNQGTMYLFEYAPQILQVFVPKRASLILLRSTLAISQAKKWWKVNR